MTTSGQTILSCLSELDRSRPYFVGLLAQRYGWHQEKNGADALLTKTFELAETHDEYLNTSNFEPKQLTCFLLTEFL